jgi:hypothetical protein
MKYLSALFMVGFIVFSVALLFIGEGKQAFESAFKVSLIATAFVSLSLFVFKVACGLQSDNPEN